jgi:hypothetical protein
LQPGILTIFDPFPCIPCPVSTFHPPSVCPSLVGAFVLASAEATFFHRRGSIMALGLNRQN